MFSVSLAIPLLGGEAGDFAIGETHSDAHQGDTSVTVSDSSARRQRIRGSCKDKQMMVGWRMLKPKWVWDDTEKRHLQPP